MRDAHGRIGGVHGLATRTGGTEHIDTQVLGIDREIDFIGFGQDGHGRRRRMDPALALRLRHSLHTMDSRLVAETSVYAFAPYREDDLLDGPRDPLGEVHQLDSPALSLGHSLVHA